MLILAELHDFRRFASAPALMAYLGLVPGEDSSGEKHRRGRITRTGNALVRRLLVETAWHYQHRPGVGVALTRRRKGQPCARDCDRGQGAAAAVSTLPEVGGGTQAGTEDRRRDRARTGGLSVGRVAAGAGDRELTAQPRRDERQVTRTGDGPRRRRMIRGTIARIGGLVMRYGHPSQLATLECTSSRRSTVMCALPRATAVTTVYQRDSSSKRPRASVVFAARPRQCQSANTASRASRPAGGAFGAPGPRVRSLTRTLYASKLTLARDGQASFNERGLTEGHSISA